MAPLGGGARGIGEGMGGEGGREGGREKESVGVPVKYIYPGLNQTTMYTWLAICF